ncbi:unnamed protein product, partial [Sphacelaria rigidula]
MVELPRVPTAEARRRITGGMTMTTVEEAHAAVMVAEDPPRAVPDRTARSIITAARPGRKQEAILPDLPRQVGIGLAQTCPRRVRRHPDLDGFLAEMDPDRAKGKTG